MAQIPKEEEQAGLVDGGIIGESRDRNQTVRGGVFDAETGVRPLALHFNWYVFRCCYAIWIWKR